MNDDTFYPYSFNGGGEYDGYAGFEERRAIPPRTNGRTVAPEDGEEEEDELMKSFSRVMEEYLNTGTVSDPKNAKIFRGVFPELALLEPNREGFANIGSGSSGMTMGDRVNGHRQDVEIEVNSLRTRIRIPESSVRPVKNKFMGDVMKDFLNEVERNVPPLLEARDRKNADRKRTRETSDERKESSEDSCETEEILTLKATLKLHAPWIAPQSFDRIEGGKVEHDMSISRKVFARYLRAVRSDRMATIMREDQRIELVTLVLESENDAWMACGGEKNALPPDTWITKRSVKSWSCEDAADNLDFPDLRQNFREFLDDMKKQGPGFVTDENTLESQVYEFFNGSTDAVSKTKEMVKEYELWKKRENKKNTDYPLTSVLREGGDETDMLQEHADRLVTLAISNGYVRTGAKNARDQLLFQNEVPKKKRLKIKDQGAHRASSSRVVDGITDAKIVEYFRKGKEKIIMRLTDDIGCKVGGPNAKLIVDLEYRTHFIKLCRANHLLKTFDHDSRVVTDRRNRILDQERIKRECLHFFQTKCGMGSKINADYLR